MKKSLIGLVMCCTFLFIGCAKPVDEKRMIQDIRESSINNGHGLKYYTEDKADNIKIVIVKDVLGKNSYDVETYAELFFTKVGFKSQGNVYLKYIKMDNKWSIRSVDYNMFTGMEQVGLSNQK